MPHISLSTPGSKFWLELELELIQPHMAQKPMLRGEVGCACVAREALPSLCLEPDALGCWPRAGGREPRGRGEQ